MMGKEQALEGDLCVCKCDPSPVMIASQTDNSQSFESHHLAQMGYGPSGNYLADERASEHWIRFSLKDKGSCEGLRCRAHFSDGPVEEGVSNSENKMLFSRPNASACQKVEVVLDSNQGSGQSVMGSLLQAMVWGKDMAQNNQTVANGSFALHRRLTTSTAAFSKRQSLTMRLTTFAVNAISDDKVCQQYVNTSRKSLTR
ncbi:MAG: hypothetical protein CBARDMAM_1019 [uncultured Caballeronia sp.]|nr:MAG: hypothetical protein CBARDMAM_1019 [uncultured Caballeronia sp.]